MNGINVFISTCIPLVIVQGIIAEKGLDVKLSGGNVIPSLNGSI